MLSYNNDWVSYSYIFNIENQIKLYKDGLLASSLELNTTDFFESPEHPNIHEDISAVMDPYKKDIKG